MKRIALIGLGLLSLAALIGLITLNAKRQPEIEKQLEKLQVEVYPTLQLYENGGLYMKTSIPALLRENAAKMTLDQTEWNCSRIFSSTDIQGAAAGEYEYSFLLEQAPGLQGANASLVFDFGRWSPNDYLLIPAAAYDGNRFRSLPKKYPPIYTPEEYDPQMPVTITDVPRLNNGEGPSRMELTSGDMTTPAVGILFREARKGMWIVTEQQTTKGNIGITFEESDDRTTARLTLDAASLRDQRYVHMKLVPADDTIPQWRPNDAVQIRFFAVVFDCDSPAGLMEKFLEVRKHYARQERRDMVPFSHAFALLEDHYNRERWDESRRYYTLGDVRQINSDWQLGWVGGCMATLPLSLIGTPQSVERAWKNYDRIITESQAPSGFFYGCGDGTRWYGDCFNYPLPDNLHLIRKNADALYFFYKYGLAQRRADPTWQFPESWRAPLRRQGRAFVDLWQREGQFGQHIDIETGRVINGGSGCGAMAVGGLALASVFEGDAEYLTVAREAARYYDTITLQRGYSTGGPGEILQNPDAESAFALLESYVMLYEVTGEPEWLALAEKAAALCATWMMSYDYAFPPTSTFGKLDMKTTGSVWASTQNKHSAPAICTFSGDALLKLYRMTGKQAYLDMIYDVAHNVFQYMARPDRPIATLHPGWINERVNTSDWEGKRNVGEVFHGTTWADVSAMLTVAEIPGIYIDRRSGQVTVFDHVQASLDGDHLRVHNPTAFDARVTIFNDADPTQAYAQGTISACPAIEVKAGESADFQLSDGGNWVRVE